MASSLSVIHFPEPGKTKFSHGLPQKLDEFSIFGVPTGGGDRGSRPKNQSRFQKNPQSPPPPQRGMESQHHSSVAWYQSYLQQLGCSPAEHDLVQGPTKNMASETKRQDQEGQEIITILLFVTISNRLHANLPTRGKLVAVNLGIEH